MLMEYMNNMNIEMSIRKYWIKKKVPSDIQPKEANWKETQN